MGTFETMTLYRVRNVDYNTIGVKIRLEGTGDPDTISFGPGDVLSFDVVYSGSDAKFKYGGHEVQQIDLNDGDSSDDLNTPNHDHNDHNTLRYVPGASEGDLDIVDFSSKTYVESFNDKDGIDGGIKANFEQTVSDDIMTLEISQ